MATKGVRAGFGRTWQDWHGRFHRDGGPAVEYDNGYKAWYVHGKRHRVGGPAREWPDGKREWWTHGKLREEKAP